jgi:acetyltransferase
MEHLFAQLSPEDIRLRFFTPMRALPPGLLARLTQIDYDREMAFVLVDRRNGEFLGVSRFSADPDNIRAEFAVTVRSDLKGHGLGRLLMQRLIAYAKSRGTAEMVGDVLEENARMLALCRELGFTIRPQSAESCVPSFALPEKGSGEIPGRGRGWLDVPDLSPLRAVTRAAPTTPGAYAPEGIGF